MQHWELGLVEKFILRICQILKNVWKMHLFLCNRVEHFVEFRKEKKNFLSNSSVS